MFVPKRRRRGGWVVLFIYFCSNFEIRLGDLSDVKKVLSRVSNFNQCVLKVAKVEPRSAQNLKTAVLKRPCFLKNHHPVAFLLFREFVPPCRRTSFLLLFGFFEFWSNSFRLFQFLSWLVVVLLLGPACIKKNSQYN